MEVKILDLGRPAQRIECCPAVGYERLILAVGESHLSLTGAYDVAGGTERRQVPELEQP
jgi:hypothetical protein